jgi:hypothetical protein
MLLCFRLGLGILAHQDSDKSSVLFSTLSSLAWDRLWDWRIVESHARHPHPE